MGLESAGAQGAEQLISTELSEGDWAADHRFRELLDA